MEHKLVKLPVLHLQDSNQRFHLCSDTSEFAPGSALCRIQNGKPKLISYTSIRFPKAARNYSITELEMCGIAINIASFMHLLKRVDFNAIVDHLALKHIIKCKVELTTTRIKKLLEILSSYLFHLYYIKGKIWYLVISYLHKDMTIAIHLKSCQFHLACKIYYKLIIII